MRDKVIITGSKGLIGSALVNHLSGSYEVIEFDLLLGHDLTNEETVIKLFSNYTAEYLINCFALNDHVREGENRETNLFSISLEMLNTFLSINTVALFSVCRQFAKNPRAKSIVNFASIYSLVSANPKLYLGREKNIAYILSKACVPQLTRHLAVHLAPNIRVNCVAPHGVENNQGKSFVENYISFSPLKRLMRNDELNGLIEYLCSDKSSYMTGAVIPIDGGWTIW